VIAFFLLGGLKYLDMPWHTWPTHSVRQTLAPCDAKAQAVWQQASTLAAPHWL